MGTAIETRAEDRYRLPREVEPSHYDLTLDVDLANASFSGVEDVRIQIHEQVEEIVLSARELTIGDGWMTPAAGDGEPIEIAEFTLDTELQRAHLRLAAPADPGEWLVHLSFEGTLNDRLEGFYRSTYEDEQGQSHVVAATQFEADAARLSFPCWDEPDRKAVFAVTLVVDEGLTAIANGAEVSRETVEGRTSVRFAETMPMSTYLVAFIVGRLECTDPIDVDGVPVRIVHVPGKGDLTGFALEAAAFSLRFFRDYYAIDYPAEKLDMIALPDFAFGAMENTGCITFRESLLLLDPDHATQEELVDIADVVAHELAHQWFGNLVTMRWWNGLWLNEAFATFMALVTVDAWRPDWEVWSTFSRAATAAKEVDALRSTRPIEYPVATPDDTLQMFDVLTYQKGAGILRMLQRYLGEERFRDGIRDYLRRHAYGNTETHDLWDAIEDATGEPVRRIMDSWIWQGGYPVVNAAADGSGVKLTQQRFLADGSADPARWEVPLRVREIGGDGDRPVLIDAAAAEATVPLGESATLVANAGASSFVRLAYDDDLRERVVLHAASLEAVERYTLVDDLWAQVTSGGAPVGSFLHLAERLVDAGEADLSVWQVMLAGLGWCDRFLPDEPRERFQGWVHELVTPTLATLGSQPAEGETDLVRALRGTLFQAAGNLAADPGIVDLLRSVDDSSRGGERIDASLATAAANVAASWGDGEDYDRFLQAFRSAPTPQIEQRYLMALPRFRPPELVARTLEAALDGTIRSQDAPFVVGAAIAGRDQGPQMWESVTHRWTEIERVLPPTLLVHAVGGVRYLADTKLADEAAEFFAEHPIPQSARNVEQLLERQRVAIGLRAHAEPGLIEFFGSESA